MLKMFVISIFLCDVALHFDTVLWREHDPSHLPFSLRFVWPIWFDATLCIVFQSLRLLHFVPKQRKVKLQNDQISLLFVTLVLPIRE